MSIILGFVLEKFFEGTDYFLFLQVEGLEKLIECLVFPILQFY